MKIVLALGAVIPLLSSISLAAVEGAAPIPLIRRGEAVELTADTLREELSRLRQADWRRFAAPAARQALARDLARGEILAIAARDAGYDRQSAVRRAINSLLARRYLDEKLEPRLREIAVTEEEIARYYGEHPGEFATRGAVRPAHILVRIPATATAPEQDAAMERAGQLRRSLLAPDAAPGLFAELAATTSDDQATRYRGGDLGWIVEGSNDTTWGKAFLDVVLALKMPGEIGPVVSTSQGLHVVTLKERREAATRPLEDVRDRIRQMLIGRRRAEAEDALIAETEKAAGIAVDRAAINAVIEEVLAAPPPGQAPPSLPSQEK